MFDAFTWISLSLMSFKMFAFSLEISTVVNVSALAITTTMLTFLCNLFINSRSICRRLSRKRVSQWKLIHQQNVFYTCDPTAGQSRGNSAPCCPECSSCWGHSRRWSIVWIARRCNLCTLSSCLRSSRHPRNLVCR